MKRIRSATAPDTMVVAVPQKASWKKKKANSGSFQGKASELIQQVLSLEPDNNTALFFAGLAADEAGELAAGLDVDRLARGA